MSHIAKNKNIYAKELVCTIGKHYDEKNMDIIITLEKVLEIN